MYCLAYLPKNNSSVFVLCAIGVCSVSKIKKQKNKNFV